MGLLGSAESCRSMDNTPIHSQIGTQGPWVWFGRLSLSESEKHRCLVLFAPAATLRAT